MISSGAHARVAELFSTVEVLITEVEAAGVVDEAD